MIKQILSLLFTFIFSINLFAESHDIHREISDMQLEIQKIKLLDARDERENKLEKLEKDIKELEEKFNQNNIDKKDIDGKIGTQDKLISEIASNTNRVSWLISMFGVLITVIIIFFALKFGRNIDQEIQNIKIEAEKELKNWVDNKAESEFKSLIDNAKNEIQLNANQVLKEIKNETLDRFDVFVKSLQRNHQNEEKYKYLDLINLIIDNYEKKNIEEALRNIDKAIKLAKTDKENIQILFIKALILGQIGKSEEAIKVYDELIERFKDSNESNILEKVVTALLNKIEINLILGNKNSIEDLDLYINLVKDSKKELLKFEMLQIFENAKNSNQDDEIKAWQIKFKDIKMENWSFDELKTWAETLEDEAKERILKYIDIFENHNKNTEGK